MKLCFLCDEYPPARIGGIGRVVQTTARALAKRGHEVRVVGNYEPNPLLQSREEDEGVKVWRLFPPRGSRVSLVDEFKARYRLFRLVASWVRTGELGVIEAPDYLGPVALWPRLRVPVIVRLHGLATLFARLLKERLPRSLYHSERLGIRRADFICAASKYVLVATSKLFPLASKPAAILFNMLPVPQEFPRTQRARWRVVYANTLTARKGVVTLIRAWPEVQSRCPEAELHLYGKDTTDATGRSMRQYLLSLLSPGLRVTFHGHVTRAELDAPFGSARVSVFPSIGEAFGLAPVEAMASGCPTIFSNRCAGPEIIEHGRSGLLIDPDRPSEIAGAILKMLLDDDAAAKYAQEGWRRVRDLFSVEALLPQLESYYEQCTDAFHNTR